MHFEMMQSMCMSTLSFSFEFLSEVTPSTFSRHLIRLWLRNDKLAWSTPEPLQPIWQRLYSVTPDEQRFPVEPEIRRKANGATK